MNMSNPVNNNSNAENKKASEKMRKEKVMKCNQKTREGLRALSRVDLPNAIKHFGKATESWLVYSHKNYKNH